MKSTFTIAKNDCVWYHFINLIAERGDIVKNYVEKILAPKLQGDGGWVEFVSFENSELTLVFRGECSKCLILHRCTEWIEGEIKRDMKKTVKVIAIRKKPYFQDV